MKSLIQFLSDLRAKDVLLSVDGDKLTCNAPMHAITPEIRQELSDRKEEILNFLRSTQGWKAAETGQRSSRDLPLSRSQQRIWFLDQLDPGNPAYNIVIPLWLTGSLDRDAMERALRAVIERHEALRTGFSQRGGRPFAWIATEKSWQMEVTDLRHLTEPQAETEATQLAWHAGRWSFDLEKPPLFRATLYQVTSERYLLCLVVQHIVADGWSLGILSREMSELYSAFAAGASSPLPDPSFQYRDYVRWEQEEGQRLAEQQLPYWLKKLHGDLPSLEIPPDRTRPTLQSLDGGRHIADIDGDFADQLRVLSRQMGATLFTVLLAAFKVLMYRYTGTRDVIVGSNTANRPRQEFSTQIGFFVNNIILRSDLSGSPTFAELVARVKETTGAAYANQNVPFDLLVEKLHPERATGHRSTLAQVMFTLENLPLPDLDLPGLKSRPDHFDFGVAGADLAVLLWPVGSGYRCEFEYSKDLFDETTIRQLQEHYLRLLKEVVANPGAPIETYPLLSDSERAQLLTEWNQTAHPGPGYPTVADWFRAQVALRPNAIAVEMGNRQLSYRELDALSDRMASALQQRGVGREIVVGLYVTRSVEMMICLLGILKAGGAYLPLDPAFPTQRIEYLIRDSAVGLIVTEKSLETSLPDSGAEVLLLEQALASETEKAAGEPARAEDLAYLIYTSGSTGQPKGTEITHGSLVNLLDSMLREPGLSHGDTLVAVTTLSFDIAGLELFGPLVSGARLVLASREQTLDPVALAELLESSDATVLQATPSTWRMLVESGWLGKRDLRMWCGGEALSAELADNLLTRGGELWNLYGPTETTIWSAAHRVSSGENPVLIGRPIANTRMYILDNRGDPVPMGVNGELYIAGHGVARGYRNRAELTTERFLPERFVAGERMYRTGDMARFRRDGQIQLLGRTDQQVKLRGHRIELGEIEAALERHAAVQQAVISVRGQDADRRLVAYVRLDNASVPSDDLRVWLQERLPEYMVPGVYVVMEEFPLTPNGKVDRNRLPSPEGRPQEHHAPALAPRNRTERRVAAIWSELLEHEAVGVRENFFDLGGHSLLLVRVHARLRDAFAADISVTDLFRFTTVESLAAHLNRHEAPAVVEGVPS